jgi:carbamoyl-phosphate synthase small subunit
MTKNLNLLQPAYLHLENGLVFSGFFPPGQKGSYFGEVVFTTGMTGYPESLTDPSYTGQILTFTFPLIGNYGVPPEKEWESSRIHARGVIVDLPCINWSHYTGASSFLEWLKQQNVPILIGVDTRQLTKTLRSSGTLLGVMSTQAEVSPLFPDPNKENLVAQASIKSKKRYGKGGKRVIAIDCGMKENIIRCLAQWPITIERVPFDYDYTHEDFDGIVLSNGPGDPIQCVETIQILQKAFKQEKPIFGICLGTQLMALAAGAKTYKLAFGHRGHNQPCIDTLTKKCYITSQNHGYAVEESSLPKGWAVTYRNLNDGSVEGIAHKTKPFFSVQFHPEASPGPTDTLSLFEQFYQLL